MCKRQTSKYPLISPNGVDRAVLSLHEAMRTSLGVPTFSLGTGSDVRSLTRTTGPLLQSDHTGVDTELFRAQYVSAHFFDRYFFADEVAGSKLLEEKALNKLSTNLERGAKANAQLVHGEASPVLYAVLAKARLHAARILGPLDLDAIFEQCKHGPNSTLSVPYKNAYLDVKYGDLCGTEDAQRIFLSNYLAWDTNLRSGFDERATPQECTLPLPVLGNKISFVPKRFDSLRTMAFEPTLNQFFQLGTGSFVSLKLTHKTSIDLASQPDVHRRLALLASKYPELGIATLDWSEASDRQWIEIFALVLSPDWFNWLMQIRSPTAVLPDGRRVDLPMMGTMGCGFTFPLQTLLYYVLLDALAEQFGIPSLGISVFGDDCLVPSALVPFVQWMANALSWKLNADKSFWDGDFRESCGMDAFRGIQVRPFFIERPADVTSKNHLKAWSYAVFNGVMRVLPAHCSTGPVWEWLMKFHWLYGLGRVLVVPFRFPDTSGAQCDIYTAPPELTKPYAFDEHGGVQIRLLQASSGRRKVEWEFPYYHVRLRGQEYPTDWKTSLFGGGVKGAVQNGFCPGRDVTYRSTKHHVFTWSYFVD